MSCPYPEEELEYWDGVVNAMGDECSSCEDFDCEHNDNDENPNNWSDGSGEPMSNEEFAKCNGGK